MTGALISKLLGFIRAWKLASIARGPFPANIIAEACPSRPLDYY